MKRFAMEQLQNWKEKEKRKPMIIMGECVNIGLNQEKPYK